MPGTRYTTEQIVAKLSEAEKLQGQGLTIPAVCKKLRVSERTFYRWRREYGGPDGTVRGDEWVVVYCGSCGSKQRVRADLLAPRCTACWRPIYSFEEGASSVIEPTNSDPLADAHIPLGVGAAVMAFIGLIVVWELQATKHHHSIDLEDPIAAFQDAWLRWRMPLVVGLPCLLATGLLVWRHRRPGGAGTGFWIAALIFAALAILGGLIVLRQPANVVCLLPCSEEPMGFCGVSDIWVSRSETSCPSAALHAADEMMTAINQGAVITIVMGSVSAIVMLGLLGYRLLNRDSPAL